jgi:hypothetical protein
MIARLLAVVRHQTCIFEHEAEVVRGEVLLAPEALAPLGTLSSNARCVCIVRTTTLGVAAEEDKRVVEVREVELDRHVVHPRLHAVDEPLREDGRFEDERI